MDATRQDAQVTINLAGRAHPIERVQVSAALGPVSDPEGREDLTQNRYTALRSFEIWACDNTRDRCGVNSDDYRLIYTSPDDARRCGRTGSKVQAFSESSETR